jgi:hypothetical protein
MKGDQPSSSSSSSYPRVFLDSSLLLLHAWWQVRHVAHHLHTLVDDILDVHPQARRRELESEHPSDVVRRAQQSIEVGLRVCGREAESHAS